MPELFWLLLPLAAVSGWFIGRRQPSDRVRDERSSFRPVYLAGLNHLLNDESDKAIETLVQLLEVDSETVEIHMALGRLYRQRGEVDRAIRIHQNLIARPTLQRSQRSDALFALGKDYLHAGLFDRAELLFKELADDRTHAQRALRELLIIYQQEREWANGIEVAQRLQRSGGGARAHMVAHFYCETADEAINRGEHAMAHKQAKQALAIDPKCVRANIILGDLAASQQRTKRALKCYQAVEQQDSDYLPLVLRRLRDCFLQAGSEDAWESYLRGLQQRHPHSEISCAYAQLLIERSAEAAESMLLEELSERPQLCTLAGLVKLTAKKQSVDDARLFNILGSSLDVMVAQRPAYQCQKCGFKAKSLHWQCPSCQEWGSVKPYVESTE